MGPVAARAAKLARPRRRRLVTRHGCNHGRCCKPTSAGDLTPGDRDASLALFAEEVEEITVSTVLQDQK